MSGERTFFRPQLVDRHILRFLPIVYRFQRKIASLLQQFYVSSFLFCETVIPRLCKYDLNSRTFHFELWKPYRRLALRSHVIFSAMLEGKQIGCYGKHGCLVGSRKVSYANICTASFFVSEQNDP